MGGLFSCCERFDDEPSNEGPTEYTPPRRSERNGKYYVVMNGEPFTEI